MKPSCPTYSKIVGEGGRVEWVFTGVYSRGNNEEKEILEGT